MPLHQRKQIRDAVAASLAAANTGAGPRVSKTRIVPWSRTELPAIAVYTLSETVADGSKSTAGRELERVMQLEIIGAVKATEDVDDLLDALAVEIERAMHKDETFGGACGESVLATTEIAVEAAGDKPIGFISLVYDVTYYTGAPEAEDVQTDALTTVDVHYNLSGVQEPADQAHDTVALAGP